MITTEIKLNGKTVTYNRIQTGDSMKLLGTNSKLDKGNGEKYLITGLSIAPHVLGATGLNACSDATPGCAAACVLWLSGRTMMPSVRAAMIRRKQWLVDDRRAFESKLDSELDSFSRKANRELLEAVARLNVASDLDWTHIIERHSEIKFFDYTKVRGRMSSPMPDNYHLTYSLNERTPKGFCGSVLDQGKNVAAVFSTRYHPQSGRYDALPERWTIDGKTVPVVDGDLIDVRLPETDGRGVIVGLRFKGSLKRRAAAIKNGFCLDADGVAE